MRPIPRKEERAIKITRSNHRIMLFLELMLASSDLFFVSIPCLKQNVYLHDYQDLSDCPDRGGRGVLALNQLGKVSNHKFLSNLSLNSLRLLGNCAPPPSPSETRILFWFRSSDLFEIRPNVFVPDCIISFSLPLKSCGVTKVKFFRLAFVVKKSIFIFLPFWWL